MTLGGLVALQTRGVGVTAAVRAALPDWAAAAFAAATTLGDTAVLVALAAAVYLGYGRRDGAFVIGTLLVGFAVVVAGKAFFGLPRPPAELQYVPAYGLGFPSGHALGATVGWGAMAVALDRLWTLRRRALVAGAVAAVVAASRVAIGVHYLVDVVAGAALGLEVLWGAARWGRERPVALFAGAVAGALVAVAVAGGSLESLALLGAAVGALTAWQLVAEGTQPLGREGVYASGGLGVLAAAGAAAVEPLAALAFAGAALLAAAVLLAPDAAARLRG